MSNVQHPKHYNSDPSGIECIEIVRHRNFNIGSAIKYLWRAGLKDDSSMTIRQKTIEDLEKSKWCIDDEIQRLKNLSADEASFVPEVGDILVVDKYDLMIMIYKGLDDNKRPTDYATYNVDSGDLIISDTPWGNELSDFRQATEEEKNMLLSKLKSFGKIWNSNKKQLEDTK